MMAFYTDYVDEFNITGNVSAVSFTSDGTVWNNVIEDFKASQYTLNEPTTIVLMVFYVPIFLTSLIGNTLVLMVIVPNQRMWTVTNNFLVNLAVADLLGKCHSPGRSDHYDTDQYNLHPTIDLGKLQ